MKYLEELQNGETFGLNDQYWLLTADFKSNGKRLCYNMNNGHAKWISGNETIELTPLYCLDKDNNILPIKKYTNETNNIS